MSLIALLDSGSGKGTGEGDAAELAPVETVPTAFVEEVSELVHPKDEIENPAQETGEEEVPEVDPVTEPAPTDVVPEDVN